MEINDDLKTLYNALLRSQSDLIIKYHYLTNESEQLRKERDELLELAKYTERACLCQRFKTKGFDYNEAHPEMGKCKGGSRWITPSKYAESLLAKKVNENESK